ALLIDNRETLKESEDESVGETRKERQTQDDGLSQEHVEWSNPNLASFLKRNTRLFQLVGPIDVRILPSLATTLGFPIHQNRRTALRHEEDNGLSNTAEDELNPEKPFPRED